MTEEQIKESLSRRFIEVLANRAGFKCTSPSPDSGVDISVTRALPRQVNGGMRWCDTGEYLELQLKCTCEGSLTPTEEGFKYDLEAKTYNDLVYRRASVAITPLVLVLVVLPDEPDEWIALDSAGLLVRRTAYWFVPDPYAAPTDNVSTMRISLSEAQRVPLSFMKDRFDEYFES